MEEIKSQDLMIGNYIRDIHSEDIIETLKCRTKKTNP